MDITPEIEVRRYPKKFIIAPREFLLPPIKPGEKSPDGITFTWERQEEGEEGTTTVVQPQGYTDFCQALSTMLGLTPEEADQVTRSAWLVAKGDLYLRLDPPSAARAISRCFAKPSN